MSGSAVTNAPSAAEGDSPAETGSATGSGAAADPADPRVSIACSFCRKPPSAVGTMVAGAGVFICNECVALCAEIIASKPADERPGERMANWEHEMSDEEVLAHLPKVAAASAQVEQQLTRWVRVARSRGITWTRIGAALGMTRQSAWERFSGEE